MPKAESKNAVTVWENPQTFQIVPTESTNVALNPELQGQFDDEDYGGFEESSASMPVVSIRQKDDLAESGETLKAGNFRIHDPVSATNKVAIADVPGNVGLVVTAVHDRTGRVYWEKLGDDRPKCKSPDGKWGVGDPGGDCAKCPLSQWGADGTPPVCKAQPMVLMYDHALKSCYVMRLNRSAIKAWEMFKAGLRRTNMPIHSFKFLITTQMVKDKGLYYVPVFTPGSQVDKDLFQEIKRLRREMTESFSAVLDVDDGGNGKANDIPMADSGDEIPPDLDHANNEAEQFL